MADILIVDDDGDLAAALADVLGCFGHVIRIALDGGAALRALDDRLPDLIVLDIEMPVLDGPGMAAQLLILDAGRERIPIILSSGYRSLAAVAARVGTPYAIAKPCSIGPLTTLLERALRERIPPAPRL